MLKAPKFPHTPSVSLSVFHVVFFPVAVVVRPYCFFQTNFHQYQKYVFDFQTNLKNCYVENSIIRTNVIT